MEPGTCPPCASQHRSCPSTGPKATNWPIVPVRKQTLEGAPVWQELTHARLPRESHPCRVRGEGRRGAAERGTPAV